MGNFFDQFDPAGISLGQPARNLGPAPNASPGAQSAPVGPMPTGALAPDWLKSQTEGSSNESNDALAQAQGGIESLQHLTRLRGLVAQAPDAAFGNFRGSNLAGSINQTLDAVTGKTLPGSDLASWHERLDSAYNDASLPMIKQLFGAVPRSPELQNKALEVLGGTRVTDKQTALGLIDQVSRDAYDKINRGVSLGRVTPGAAQQRIQSGAMPSGSYQWDPQGGLRPK